MHVLRGIFASFSIAVTTVGVCAVLFVWYVQYLLASSPGKSAAKEKLDRIIVWWTQSNRWMIRRLNLVTPELRWQGKENVSPKGWYLVVCNHQTWADILLLQSYLLDDIPPLKFFTKSQLIWLPFIGLAMYALGFPYVKRVDREAVKKNPELRNADKDNVLKVCKGFKNHPTSILNFLEGTRRTHEKHQHQGSHYQHLLKPKAGGIAYIFEGMGSNLDGVVDVTLIYPDGAPTFWDFLQGKCRRVIFDARYRELPELSTSSADDRQLKAEVARWVGDIWSEKDQLIEDSLATTATV